MMLTSVLQVVSVKEIFRYVMNISVNTLQLIRYFLLNIVEGVYILLLDNQNL